MKYNKIIFIIILVLISGLFFSLKNTNKEVDSSFKIYSYLSDLKNMNYYIDDYINNTGSKNYDIINGYIATEKNILVKVQKSIIQNNIQDKAILNYFNILKKDSKVKLDIINQYKTSNSITNNTYQNSLQLFDIAKTQVDEEDKIILDDFLHHLLSLNKTLEIYEVEKYQDLLFNKYKSNYTMQLLYKNIILYQSHLINIKRLQKKAHELELIVTIDDFEGYYISYNQKLLDKSIIIIFILIAILLFILLISFLLTKNLEKTYTTIEELNNSLEDKIKQEVEKNRQKDHQILEQSRLAQMGEMISMIAHQWRQPLAAISSSSGAINLKAKLNKLESAQAIELSDKISNFSQHLSTTIDDFRDFFKPNKQKGETTYSKIIDNVLGIVKTSIENQNITIVTKLDSQVTFNTYSNKLKQVVLNLIKNAEDVLLENNVKNPTITIETKDNTLIVSDNGGGIADDIIDKVFDPYFSTKAQKDGTGLGLYMSKIIIEEHCNGKINVSNDKDGAVFSIVLDNEIL